MRDTATRQGRDLVAEGYLVLLQEPHADAVSSLHRGKLGCTQGRPSRQKHSVKEVAYVVLECILRHDSLRPHSFLFLTFALSNSFVNVVRSISVNKHAVLWNCGREWKQRRPVPWAVDCEASPIPRDCSMRDNRLGRRTSDHSLFVVPAGTRSILRGQECRVIGHVLQQARGLYPFVARTRSSAARNAPNDVSNQEQNQAECPDQRRDVIDACDVFRRSFRQKFGEYEVLDPEQKDPEEQKIEENIHER